MPAAGRSPLPVLLVAVLAVFTAQQALAPVLAPLAREIGLPEVALGALMTAAATVVVAVALVVVVVVLPAGRDSAPDPGSAPRVRGLKPWDARLWPVLLGGFGLYLALSMILIVLGFLVQDRLSLDAATTVTTTGFASVEPSTCRTPAPTPSCCRTSSPSTPPAPRTPSPGWPGPSG